MERTRAIVIFILTINNINCTSISTKIKAAKIIILLKVNKDIDKYRTIFSNLVNERDSLAQLLTNLLIVSINYSAKKLCRLPYPTYIFRQIDFNKPQVKSNPISLKITVDKM